MPKDLGQRSDWPDLERGDADSGAEDRRNKRKTAQPTTALRLDAAPLEQRHCC